MQQHLQACHDGISISAYRHRVLRSSLTEWPQPVSPQLLRSRLAAFKMEMSDANYKLVVCACCALEKRRFEVTRVSIPPPSASEAPAWLGYSTQDWLRHAEDWYAAMHRLFGIDRYLDGVFGADEHIRQARAVVQMLENGEDVNNDFASVEEATAWLRRVEQWCENLRKALTLDSVPSPA